MRVLTPHDVLRIWEAAEGHSPPDRALTVLTTALPEVPPERLADLSLGRRDRLLLAVRAGLYGPALRGVAECPCCRERLEFIVADLPSDTETNPVEGAALELAEAGYELCFRPPTGGDLAAAAACGGLEAARELLVRRCVLGARRDGAEVAPGDLPAAVLARLAERLAESDPGALVLLGFTCPACGHGWQEDLDVAAFFWTELAAHARRLLREVHALARAYGWREADILALSGRRRQAYLELVGV